MRNFNYRLGLVHKAEQLALEEDNRAATAAARELRQQWQVSVRSHNRKEKQLWQSFNKAMDQVFNKDRAAREQFRASLDENQHKAETLCKQLEQLSKSDDQAIRSSRAELQQLVDQFTALNLPKRSRRQLETRFDKASKAYRQRAESADNALRQQQLEQLYTLHSLCAQLEAMALGLQAGTHTADDLKSRWEEAARPPRDKSVLHHIEQRCQAAMKVINGDQGIDALGDLAGNTKRKRALCTDLEILLHVESPGEERGQRMQRQVEMLEDAMKGGAQDSSEHIRELKLAFISCGPTDADSHENIESRFAQLLQA